MAGRRLWFLRSYLMARKILGDWSPGTRSHLEGVAIAHENKAIRQNSSFLAVKSKTTKNGHGREVAMVL